MPGDEQPSTSLHACQSRVVLCKEHNGVGAQLWSHPLLPTFIGLRAWGVLMLDGDQQQRDHSQGCQQQT